MRETAGEVRIESSVTLSYGNRYMDVPVFADQEEKSYNSSVWTRGIVWRIYHERWRIGTTGENESGKCMLAARRDDDDDDDVSTRYSQ